MRQANSIERHGREVKEVEKKKGLIPALAEFFVRRALDNRRERCGNIPFTQGEADLYAKAFRLAAKEIMLAVSSAPAPVCNCEGEICSHKEPGDR